MCSVMRIICDNQNFQFKLIQKYNQKRIFSTSLNSSTQWKCMPSFKAGANSSKSPLLPSGIMTSSIPSLLAARTFSFNPPMRKTLPENLDDSYLSEKFLQS